MKPYIIKADRSASYDEDRAKELSCPRCWIEDGHTEKLTVPRLNVARNKTLRCPKCKTKFDCFASFKSGLTS